MPYWSLCSRTHCRPARRSEACPLPEPSRTRTETRFASGAMPAIRPCDSAPLPTRMPATCVPWPCGSTPVRRAGRVHEVHRRHQLRDLDARHDPRVDQRDRHPRSLERTPGRVGRGLARSLACHVHRDAERRIAGHELDRGAPLEGREPGRRQPHGHPARGAEVPAHAPAGRLHPVSLGGPGLAVEADDHVDRGRVGAFRQLLDPAADLSCMAVAAVRCRCDGDRGAKDGRHRDGLPPAGRVLESHQRASHQCLPREGDRTRKTLQQECHPGGRPRPRESDLGHSDLRLGHLRKGRLRGPTGHPAAVFSARRFTRNGGVSPSVAGRSSRSRRRAPPPCARPRESRSRSR